MPFDLDNITETEQSTRLSTTTSKKEIDFFSDSKKWHTHWIMISALWVMFIIALAVFTIRAAHFVIPDSWCWLSPEKLQNIDKFLFSGAFGGILAKYAGYLFR
jgi:hypothetical protein